MSELEMYLEFRKEIDTLFFPKFKKNNTFFPLIDKEKAEYIGFMLVENKYDYIDALYVRPQYRRRGYGKKIVASYISVYGMPQELRILNNNKVALKFWNSIFDLKPLEDNGYDTLYYIKRLK